MSQQKWPQDYKNWKGSFEDLVETVGHVIEQISPGTAKPTASLVRHYQQINAVGRGIKQGRSSVFGFDDLAAVIATKGLVKQGLGLGVTSTLVKQASPAMLEAYSTPDTTQSTATDTVAALMAQAGLAADTSRPPDLAHPLTALRSFAARNSAVPQAAMYLASSPKQEIRPVDWLAIYYSPSDMTADSQAARNRAADTLEALAKTVRTPGTSTP